MTLPLPSLFTKTRERLSGAERIGPTIATVRRLICLLSLAAASVHAEVRLASPFSDHMVLQCEMKVPVWGTAEPGEAVTIEFGGQKKHTTADDAGRWRIDLDPLAASTRPRNFSVGGSLMAHPKVLRDVLVGEVWICSGQSNMERQLGPRAGQKPIDKWEQEAASANFPLIRQLYVKQVTALSPQSSAEMSWTVCSPDNVVDFSAVGFFFARDLHKKFGVPVGIIHTSWGGTPVEAWTSAEALQAFPAFAGGTAMLAATARDPEAAERAYHERLAKWYSDTDPGSREPSWSTRDLDTSTWETMSLPTPWEKAGHAGFNGLVWFRKTFDLPSAWNGGDVELRLTAIDDVDTTWVNGTFVGTTDFWQTPRAYRVPGSALKRTGNTIAVRVLDTAGDGGLWNAELPFEVASLDDSFAPLSLRGAWRARFAVELADNARPPTNVTKSAYAPTVLYNGMIAPLVPYAIRGATFYQGEANAQRAVQYRTLFPAMIADWRTRWGQGDFPFLFVQIAPYLEMPPEIREAQLLAWKATKNTAMVVTLDCGDAEDIHPTRKEPVGARLALAARALAYAEPLTYSGPVYDSMSMRDGSAVLRFTHVGAGLMAKGGALMGFTIAGADGVFRSAHAEIVKDTVVVSIPEVPEPVAVRYAWENVPMGNLFNAADLPASPFRTDVK